MSVELCLHRLAYLEEVGKDVPVESYSGYTLKGCSVCGGFDKGCDSYYSVNGLVEVLKG